MWLRSGIAASSCWQCRSRFGFAVASQGLHAGNAGLASASQWHRSVFTLAIQALLGIAVASQRLHAVTVGLASVSPWHRSVFTPAMQASLRLRSGIAAYSRWQCRSRFGFAVASQHLHAFNAGLATATQWHRSVFTLAMQASLRLRSGIEVSSRWQCKSRFGFAVASQWLRSVFTPTMLASLGFAVASQRIPAVYAGLASASLWHHSVFTL